MLKKILPWFVFAFFGALLVAGYALKDRLNNYVSTVMQNQAGSEVTASGEALINKNYNYTKNGGNYQFTLLEFGSTNCTPCKRMEAELAKIRKTQTETVNVVFYNVMHPESQSLIKYYGVSAIPLQIILDREGNEIFRHFGYIAAEELTAKFALH